MTDLISAYRDPEGYAKGIDIGRIVADEKVHGDGVDRYRKLISEGAEIKPLIVIKHPSRDEYAVLNGHHRFWALKKAGAKTVRCAVVEDYVGLGFHMTKNGFFQPTAEFTKYVRVPAKEFQLYMGEFLKDPKGMLERQLGMK